MRVVGTEVNPHDAMGPTSRTTPIVFSEIMWKPAPRTDGKNLEFLELYNSNPWFQDISGYQITCADMNYTFPRRHPDSRRRLSGGGGGAGGHDQRLWHHQCHGALHRQPQTFRDAGIAG